MDIVLRINMLIYYILVFIFAEPLVVVAGQQNSNASQHVIAAIDDFKILQKDIDLELKLLKESGKFKKEQTQDTIRDALIERFLLAQMAEKNRLDEKPEIAHLLRWNKYNILAQAYIRNILDSVSTKITKQDVRNYYSEHISELNPKERYIFLIEVRCLAAICPDPNAFSKAVQDVYIAVKKANGVPKNWDQLYRKWSEKYKLPITITYPTNMAVHENDALWGDKRYTEELFNAALGQILLIKVANNSYKIVVVSRDNGRVTEESVALNRARKRLIWEMARQILQKELESLKQKHNISFIKNYNYNDK